ncbi:MAG: hypothetical protein ACRCUS_10625, partial [Anaerovoracaceae bacterium]
TAIEYYKILCKIIEPRFRASRFVQMNEGNTAEFEIANKVFYINTPSTSTETNDEIISIYEVISSKELYQKYEGEIECDDDMFFNNQSN